MNTLITTFTGGMPIYADDFKFIQDANIEILNALAKGLNLDSQVSFRMTGADWYVTNSGGASPLLYVNEGYIYVEYNSYKGVYKVDAVSIALPNGADETFVTNNYFWDLAVSYIQPAGTKLFLDGNTHDVYKVEKAVFTTTPTTWVGISSLKSLDEAITTKINTPTLKKLIDISGWDMANTPEIQLSHNLDINKIRSVSVYIVSDSDASEVRHYQLPVFDPITGAMACFISKIRGSSVWISRISGSFFATTTDFNDGNSNRGYAIIEYVL